MPKIRCSNETCRKEESQILFTISITVDEDREVAETLNRIPPSYFRCSFCDSEAEEVDG